MRLLPDQQTVDFSWRGTTARIAHLAYSRTLVALLLCALKATGKKAVVDAYAAVIQVPFAPKHPMREVLREKKRQGQ